MAAQIDQEKSRSCAACTCFNLRKASRVITQLFDREMRPRGLRATQFSILAVLTASGSETITRLSEMLSMDRTTLTRNLGPMEKRGYLRITRGADMRTKEVSLTERGRDAFVRSFPQWDMTQQRIIEQLGRERFRRLIRDLADITALFSSA